MNPSCARSATIGVEYCLPEFLPVCRIAAAYQFFRPASVRMTGLSKYLFEVRTARSSGRGQVPGASATSLTIPACRLRFSASELFKPGKNHFQRQPQIADLAMVLSTLRASEHARGHGSGVCQRLDLGTELA